MSLHIGLERRTRALEPSEVSEGDHGHATLLRAVGAFAAVAALAGVGSCAYAFSTHDWRLALFGSTLLIMSVIAGAVLVVHRTIADRREFYRRGRVDGWYDYYRGQAPGVDDPLLPE